MTKYTLLKPLLDNRVADHITIEADNVSDGYHTMSELYNHRIALFAALCNFYGKIDKFWDVKKLNNDWGIPFAWKSKLHSDGTMFEGGYFIAGLQTKYGQITYHMKLKWWDNFQIAELSNAPEYDNHTSQDVIERLLKL